MYLDKIKKILVNEYFLLAVITLVALFVRLLNIDIKNGLWYDEILTYVFASKSLPFGIIKTLWENDFHMPLYYFFIHLWIKFFGPDDVILRLSSVMWGIFAIPASYYLGKVYKSKALGYLLAVITALSPVMIFYSQELRFYSMLIFFSMLSLTFFLKLLDDPSKKNFALFFISNLVILYIYTMGIIFVSVEIAVLLFHLYFYKKSEFKNAIKYTAMFLVAIIPYFVLLFSYLLAAQRSLTEIFIWTGLNRYTPLFLINDWFSPLLAGVYSQCSFIYEEYFRTPRDFINLMSASATSILFVTGFLLCLTKLNRKMTYLLVILFSFLGAEAFLCLNGSFLVVTKYTIIIWPILLLTCGYGILSIEKKILKWPFIALIVFLFIGNIFNYREALSYSKLRIGGVKAPAEILIRNKIGKNDYILYPEGLSEFFRKYVKDVNLIEYNIDRILYNDKTKMEQRKLFDKNFIATTNKKNSSVKLMPYLSTPGPTKEMKTFIDSSISKMKKGNRLVLISEVFLNERFSQKEINSTIKAYKNGEITDKDYKIKQFVVMRSKIFSDLKTAVESNPSIEKKKDYTVYIGFYAWKWKLYFYQKV